MKKNCLNCQKPFSAQRASAKFCSDNCKLVFNRKHKITVSDSVSSVASNDTITPEKTQKNISVSKDKKLDPLHDPNVSLDDYLFSDAYTKDIREFTKNNPNRTVFGWDGKKRL